MPKKTCSIRNCGREFEHYKITLHSGRLEEVYACPLHGPQSDGEKTGDSGTSGKTPGKKD